MRCDAQEETSRLRKLALQDSVSSTAGMVAQRKQELVQQPQSKYTLYLIIVLALLIGLALGKAFL